MNVTSCEVWAQLLNLPIEMIGEVGIWHDSPHLWAFNVTVSREFAEQHGYLDLLPACTGDGQSLTIIDDLDLQAKLMQSLNLTAEQLDIAGYDAEGISVEVNIGEDCMQQLALARQLEIYKHEDGDWYTR